MPDHVNEQVTDAVTMGNVKGLAEMAQTAMGLSVQNAVANQQTVQSAVNAALQNGITMAQNALHDGLAWSRAVNARSLRFALDQSAQEAAAFEKTLGAEISDRLAEINGALAASQQSAKIANTTPPETGIAQQLASLNAALVTIMESLRSNRPAP